jgi:ankyrin repeat protein
MLAWAVERGLLAVASRALELGADPNGQDDFGATLLMHAAWQVRLAASSSLHNIPTRCRFQVALFRPSLSEPFTPLIGLWQGLFGGT